MLATWPCPDSGEELLVRFDKSRDRRVLVLPALFEEGNKLRHFTVEVMRALDAVGLDSFLPDLAGMNESLAPLDEQTLATWRTQAQAAAKFCAATHVLTMRGGALLDAGDLPGRRYAPVEGASVLKAMLRARLVADRESGVASNRENLLERGRKDGLTLAGYALGAAMICELEHAVPAASATEELVQSAIGGSALWLRAEPSHDHEQAMTLAELMLESTR